jgi:hypothetical protein
MKYYIKTSIENILESMENNKLVLFIGAGVSMNSGLPSWNSLILEFAKKIYGKNFNEKINPTDFLKIPQLFYNERGKKEYIDLVNKVFDKNVEPNNIHKLIFELNPFNIITTNYDDLIEQQMYKSREKFYPVKENSDLPYSNTNKMIIKMHGDLKKKNFVLKEDDYLSYSQKFCLIENYIKSLFASNIILFIGYSLQDWDFQLIFQWVKDILKSDFQSAYLLDVTNKYNHIDFNYYKNKGINVLYYDELKDLKRICEKDTGKRTENFLNYIIDFSEKKDTIDFYFEKLSIISKLNYVNEDIINKMIIPNANMFGSRIILNKEEDIKYLKRIKTDKNFRKKIIQEKVEKIRFINDILRKTGITSIKDKQYKNIFRITKRKTNLALDDFQDDLIHFNFNQIKKKINLSKKEILKNFDCASSLRIAFYNYEIGEYEEAYYILTELSDNSFHRNDFFYFFISEFNRKHLKNLLRYSSKRKEYFRDIEKIDLDVIFTKLPLSYRKKMAFFKEILNFQIVYNKLREILHDYHKIEETKRINESAFARQSNSTIDKIITDSLELWNFIHDNYLMIGHYTDVKLIFSTCIRSIIINSSMKLKPNRSKEDEFLFSPSKYEKYDYFVVDFMVNNVDSKELNNLLSYYSMDNLYFSNVNEILTSFQSCIESFKIMNNNILFSNYKSKVNNFLIILSRMELDKEAVSLIIEHILSWIKQTERLIDLEYINIFLKMKFKIIGETSYSILEEIIRIVAINNLQLTSHFGLSKLIDITKYIVTNEYKENYTIKKSKFGFDLINFYNSITKNEDKKSFILNVFTPIYELVNKTYKQKISKINIEFLDFLIEKKNKVYFCELYHMLVLNKRRIPKKYEIVFISYFLDGELNDYLNLLINVIKIKKIKKQEIFEKFVGMNSYFDILYDINNIKKVDFKVSDLLFLNKKEHQSIKDDKDLFKIVVKKLRNEIFKENCDKEYKELLFKYYL